MKGDMQPLPSEDTISNEQQHAGKVHKLTYRITGELARRRIRPLLDQFPSITWVEAEENLDFVWETHVPRAWKDAHAKAKVLNRLLHSSLLENKANLALLQHRMTVPTLQTFILRGSEVRAWAEQRWGTAPPPPEQEPDSSSSSEGGGGEASPCSPDWWMVKATGANGGADVFVLHRSILSSVLPRLLPTQLYVVQRYVARPCLYQGRKFHFRCYAILRGDLRAYLYRRAYILAASNQYSLDDTEDLTHLTNLSVNKAVGGYPGEIPVTLPLAYPRAYEGIKEVWRDLVRAAAPFMAVQASCAHLEFFGLDLMVDEDGTTWLLEANRLPGITSSKANEEEEDRFFDAVLTDLLGLCVLPVLVPGTTPKPGDWELVNGDGPASTNVEGDRGMVMEVGEQAAAAAGWKNVLRFGMFKSSILNNKHNHDGSHKKSSSSPQQPARGGEEEQQHDEGGGDGSSNNLLRKKGNQ